MNENRGLWRGKRDINTNEWVIGWLSYRDNDPVQSSAEITVESGCNYSIDPSTLGECTGLTDKNGKLIFEGDILCHNGETLHEVVFEQRNGNAYFGWVMNQIETWRFDLDFLRQMEVVDNIHDNPELMEREEGAKN